MKPWWVCQARVTIAFCSFRYWAVAAPAYLCVGVVVFVVLYFATNLLMVPTLDSPYTVTGKWIQCQVFLGTVQLGSSNLHYLEIVLCNLGISLPLSVGLKAM